MGYYDEISTGYEELHKEEQLNKIALIKILFHPEKTDKLLDVGCGTGLTTEPWDCIRYGVDPAPKLLERSRQRDKIEYKLAPAESIPFPDNYFDHVISITAIQNFQDIEQGLKEIRRVGKSSFILTFLKKSQKAEFIEAKIRKLFKVKDRIEENKDYIFIAA